MCGIAALFKSYSVHCPAGVLDSMRDEISYRGPDDRGSKLFRRSRSRYAELNISSSESAWEIGLAHRRLSILDLSHAGHQPMNYRDRYWIVFNGEIYNFIELRTELQHRGHIFHSLSDTEVILAAYAEWGLDCFARFRGMWGILILDCERNEVIICRDRLGIKPLYLWEQSGLIAICSEIKQLLHIPSFTPRLDPIAAALYLQTGYEGQDRSFFKDITPVPPGHWLTISLENLKLSSPEQYWHPERVQVAITNPAEAARLFTDKLQESVRIHLRSDVPVGCALSGGLDSSAIAVLVHSMKEDHSAPLHTFTSTFPGHRVDERQYVDAVLGRIHALPHFTTPDPCQFLEELDRFVWIHDEPVGGLSIYAGYSVAHLTRQAGVSVTLNGQGGDEVLSGYWQTYFLHLRDLWRQGRTKDMVSHFMGAALGKGNSELIRQTTTMLRRYRSRKTGMLRLHHTLATTAPKRLQEILAMDEHTRRVHEIRTMFLPQLLKWDDRNSMAFSVEGRYPFLDHELIELCLSFSAQTLYSAGWVKQPVRLGLQNILPPEICHRRSKIGFETPQNEWLYEPLRPAIESLFQKDRQVWDYVERESAQPLLEGVQRHRIEEESGQTLFRILMFDRWLHVFGVQA